MEVDRIKLGKLLVDAHMLEQVQLDGVLALQETDGRRLGTLLVEMGFVGETQLTQILSQQLSVPWVSLSHVEFTRPLLDMLPRELATRHCLVPVHVRTVPKRGRVLYVAMDDPTNEDALAECASAVGMPTQPMIAPPSDIRAAIRTYYLDGEGGAAAAES